MKIYIQIVELLMCIFTIPLVPWFGIPLSILSFKRLFPWLYEEAMGTKWRGWEIKLKESD